MIPALLVTINKPLNSRIFMYTFHENNETFMISHYFKDMKPNLLYMYYYGCRSLL